MNFQKICVIGLGYIGLPTASTFAAHGMNVLGVDINSRIIETLNKGDIQKIVSIELDKVAGRLLEHNLKLVATPAAISSLAEQGFDPELGARPLKRVIQQKVEDPLSDAILGGTFKDGDTVQVAVNEDGEILLKPARTRKKVKTPEPEPVA